MPKRRRRKKLPLEHFEASVTDLSHDGRGIAHLEGKTTFLFGALPGETVKFQYTLQRSSFDEGSVTEVITPSPDRATPPCPHFGVCGGCSLQHMNHDTQLAHKQKAFLELLQHQAGIQPKTLLKPLTGDTLGYRRKARLSTKCVPKKDKVILGFRERGGRLVADIDACCVLDKTVGEKLTKTRDMLYTLTARNTIPQLEIAIANVTAVIVRHLEPLDKADTETLINFAKENDWQLYFQPKGLDTVHCVYPDNANPLLHYTLHDFNLTLDFHPTQFIQVNDSINQQMIQRALQLLDVQKTDTVLDLFCGIGNFTLPLALHAKHVTGIEADNTAILQARANAKKNNLNNLTFFCDDLFQEDFNVSSTTTSSEARAQASAKKTNWLQAKYTKLVLDPPRAGAKEIMSLIPRWNPEKILYVSCNPATLARDAKTLSELGYTLTHGGIMDMFPHTQHVEAITLFEKTNS